MRQRQRDTRRIEPGADSRRITSPPRRARRRPTRQRRAATCAGDHRNRQRLLGQPRYAGGYQAIFRKRHQYHPDASRVGGIFQLSESRRT